MICGVPPWVIRGKVGPWTERDLDFTARRWGVDRAALAAAVGKAAEPKLTTVTERLDFVDRLQHELRLLDTGLPPKVAHWIAHERDRDRDR